jgi:hypothetical protein
MNFNFLSMRLIINSFPQLKGISEWRGKTLYQGVRLVVYLKNVLDRFMPTDGCLLGIINDNTSSNYLMTCTQQSTFEASGIEWPALRNHIPYMAHTILLPIGALMNILAVKKPHQIVRSP